MNNEFSLDKPPRGIKLERSLDGDTVIKVRLLSTATIKLLGSALCMNTLLFLFEWKLFDFSNTGNDITPMLWYLRIFLMPLIAVGVFLLLLALFKLFGKCEIRLGSGEGSIFSGIGSIGRTQRFLLNSVVSLEMRSKPSKLWTRPPGGVPTIIYFRLFIKMNNGHEIKSPDFGELRGTWLLFALGKILNRPTKETQEKVWES